MGRTITCDEGKMKGHAAHYVMVQCLSHITALTHSRNQNWLVEREKIS